MNRIEPGLRKGQYDFLWSTCSLEHVGSVFLGARFVIDAMESLQPGGVAVHTVEYNLGPSHTETSRAGGTSVWRREDVDDLMRDLSLLGYIVAPTCWWTGDSGVDRKVDQGEPQYRNNDHMKLKIYYRPEGGVRTCLVATSFAFTVQKPLLPSSSTAPPPPLPPVSDLQPAAAGGGSMHNNSSSKFGPKTEEEMADLRKVLASLREKDKSRLAGGRGGFQPFFRSIQLLQD